MTRALVLSIAVLLAGAAATSRQTPVEPVDTAAVAKIRGEGLQRSQVMDTAFWLTDRYGPRLTGSPEFEEAGAWVMDRLRAWGLANVHEERFPSGRGWSLVRFHATMVEPRVMPMAAMPQAWSPGLPAAATAEVVRPLIATAADAARYRGTLRGKIVLTQPVRDVRMLEQGDGMVLRYADHGNRWLDEALTPAPEPPTLSIGTGAAGGFDLERFYKTEGVTALFDRGDDSDLSAGGSNLSWVQQRADGGTFVVEGTGATLDPRDRLPRITLAVEPYNRLVRLVDHGVPVKVEVDLETRFTDDTQPRSFNVVADLPGTDKSDELVVIGAHLDSWHAGTGATDNAAGVAAMMEALRILHTASLAPRRTIRLVLWGSEESGLWNGLDAGEIGSKTYVRDHLGTPAAPRPEQAKTSVYFNLDNGTGRIRGVWMQGQTALMPILGAWTVPLRDLGVDVLSPRFVQQTDHESFEAAGVPAFEFMQERYEYNSRTHHTNMDVYDRLQPDDLKQMATVAAVFAWQAASRDALLPRAARGPGR